MNTAEDIANLLAKRFGQAFGENTELSPRKKRERRSTQTRKQRRRIPQRTQRLSVRTTPATQQLVRDLAAAHDMTVTGVVEAALQMFAEAKGRGDV